MEIIARILSASLPVTATYALLGLSWVIIFRTSRVRNFAVGQFIILVPYVLFGLSETLGLPLWAGLPLSLAIGTAISVGSYRLIVARLVGQPLFAQIILTFGLAIVLDRAIAIVWGQGPRILDSLASAITWPPLRLGDSFIVSSTTVAMWSVVLVMYGGVSALLRRSRIGLEMRATAGSPHLAALSGVNVAATIAVAWGISLLSASLAGVVYSAANILTPSTVQLGLRGIAPAFVGGLDSVGGTLAGAAIIAVIEVVSIMAFGAEVRDAVAWLMILGVLWLRPQGLFGTREIVRA